METNQTIYVKCDRYEEHEIECNFSVKIENDGIGEYEFWGHREYDKGHDYPVLDEVFDCYLVRLVETNDKNKILPGAKSIHSYINKATGKEHWYYCHYRKIQPNDDIYEAIEEYLNDSDASEFEEEWPDPDLEYERMRENEI